LNFGLDEGFWTPTFVVADRSHCKRQQKQVDGIYSDVSTQHSSVTDKQTDRQTDRHIAEHIRIAR